VSKAAPQALKELAPKAAQYSVSYFAKELAVSLRNSAAETLFGMAYEAAKQRFESAAHKVRRYRVKTIV